MKPALLTAVALFAGCDSLAPPPPAPPPPLAEMPWLQGFRASASSDLATPAAAARIAGALRAAPEDDYGGLELRADLVGDPRRETVLASYRLGVAVLDPAGQVIARAPGLDESGSADELRAIAAGDGQLGAPLVLVATQAGGHREAVVTLAIYRVIQGRALQRVFSAPIERRDGSETSSGALTFSRDGLQYRAPGARAATPWVFDAGRGRYVERRDRPGAPPS